MPSNRCKPLTTEHAELISSKLGSEAPRPSGYAGANELFDISEVRGGSPYGAATLAGGDGSRQPTDKELAIARYQGEKVARLTARMGDS